MEEKYLRISQIENYLSILITKAKISDNVFVGEELPTNISKDWESMVLIDVIGQNNRGAFGSGTANIYLYAKPTGHLSRKNMKLLDKMEETLNATIKNANDTHFAVHINWRDSGYDKDCNFHYNVISLHVTSK